MRFASVSSGSKGNALLIHVDNKLLLIDCGISVSQLEKGMNRLGVQASDLDAVFVTHEHSDHIRGIRTLLKRYTVPVYMTYGTAVAEGLVNPDATLPCGNVSHTVGQPGQVRIIDNFSAIHLDGVTVRPVAVPHDAREPCQYTVSAQVNGFERRLGVLTDLGSFTPHVIHAYTDCHALVLECNHDVTMLQQGSYPASLKRRVGGDWGHLSNHQASRLLEQLNADNCQWVVLAHISEKNNKPDLALQAIGAVFDRPEFIKVARQDEGFDWLDVV